VRSHGSDLLSKAKTESYALTHELDAEVWHENERGQGNYHKDLIVVFSKLLSVNIGENDSFYPVIMLHVTFALIIR
jgi:hypothetical protein